MVRAQRSYDYSQDDIDRGFFEGQIEHYDLDDMQGVLGLKALRVAIPGEPPAERREPGIRPTPEEAETIGVS